MNKFLQLSLIWLMLLSGTISIAQITGKVTDVETGEPLIAVNIRVESSDGQVGTVTDFDGNYSIEAAAGDALIYTYVGYTTERREITEDQVINVQMQFGQQLDEVVVVGYGSVAKKDLTGVVSKVDERVFNKGINTSPENLLSGKVAGLRVVGNGEPGGRNALRIRGGTSLGAGNDPLIVVDGVPLDSDIPNSSRNALNFINPNDVASVSVLKDASAAAIYGSRGANGVIIITTKSGKAGRMQVNYSGSGYISQFAGEVGVFDAESYRAAILAKAPQEFDFLGDASTDWVDVVTDDAFGMEHNLSVSGGNKNFNYRVGGGYQKVDGILKTSGFDKKTIAANLNSNLLDNRLELNFNSKTAFTNDQITAEVMNAALKFDPTRPVYLPENEEYGGYFEWSGLVPGYSRSVLAVKNPLASLELADEKGETIRTINSLSAKYNFSFLEGLSFKTLVSRDYTLGQKTSFKDTLLWEVSTNRDEKGLIYNEEDIELTSDLLELYLNYDWDLNPSIRINSTIGYSWQDFDNKRAVVEEGVGLFVDENGEWDYKVDREKELALDDNRLISYFARTNIDLKDRYLLTASIRRDGSSRFGLDNQFGWFPSLAFGWRILEEPFAAGLKNTFSNLKLRLGYGVTGNEAIGDYRFNVFYRYSLDDARVQFGDDYVRTLRGIGVDPSIQWERTQSTNIGLDFGFWNNRISGTIDVYRKFTDELLAEVAAPAFTNLSDRILTNIGEMENQGVELELNVVAFDSDDLGVDFSFNTAYNQNEILKLDNSNDPDFPGYESGGIDGDVGQTIQVIKVGESVGSFRTYKHKMLNGKPLNDFTDHNGDGLVDDLDIYEDLNGDGIINEDDLAIVGTAIPDWILGLTVNVRWRKFDFSGTLRANLGNSVYNNVASSLGYYQGLTESNVTNNIHESAFINDFNERQLKSDVYIEDASFLRLDNISVGYNFDFSRIIQSLRIYATAQNLLTITQYSGIDPELPQFATGPFDGPGIDNNVYPISRRFILGINANF